jgi:gas vesicle protein
MTTRAEHSMNLFGVMTLAALAGAAAALLFAPRKGSETRDQLIQKMHHAKDVSRQKMEAMKSKARDGMEATKDKASEKTEDTVDVVTEARSQIEDAAAETSTRPRTRRTPPSAPL